MIEQTNFVRSCVFLLDHMIGDRAYKWPCSNYEVVLQFKLKFNICGYEKFLSFTSAPFNTSMTDLINLNFFFLVIDELKYEVTVGVAVYGILCCFFIGLFHGWTGYVYWLFGGNNVLLYIMYYFCTFVRMQRTKT